MQTSTASAPDPAPPAACGDALQICAGRRREWLAAVEALERADRRIANLRLIVFGAGLLLLFAAILSQPMLGGAALAAGAAFLALVIRHDRTLRSLDNARRTVTFYRHGVERLTGEWAGKGRQGLGFNEPTHPYAPDLDLFGRGSLFERICSAHTPDGQALLASWLLAPADPPTVKARQAAVRELSPRLALREELARLSDELPPAARTHLTAAWGAAPAALSGWAGPAVAILMAACNVAASAAWAVTLSPLPLVVSGTASALLLSPWGRRISRVVNAVQHPAAALRPLGRILARLEREPFESEALCGVRDRMMAGGQPSRRIGALLTLYDYLESRRNVAFMPFAALLLWPAHWAFAIERWRARHGAEIEAWFAAVAEFEALISLAAYAWERPEDIFPSIEQGPSRFCAKGIAHPLLPPEQAVRNDVSLGVCHSDGARLWLVSGSNMSGKSTLLRSVGVNAILAQAGAPVCAESLALSPLQVGASIRTQDSLELGISRFYAEILRLKQIVGMSREGDGALFLLDEILHGTNSHDRRIGAESVLRALDAAGAIGMATTHDLALAEIADSADLSARNVHFADELVEGRMTFDYRLRDGVVRHSNALQLMQSIGLDV